MTEVPDWAKAIPNDPSIHTMPTTPLDGSALGLGLDQLVTFVKNLVEGIIREVVLRIVGVLLPGPAGDQLANWALGLIDDIGSIFDSLLGIDLSPGGIIKAITDAVQKLINAFLSVFTGSGSGSGDLGGLQFLLTAPLQILEGLKNGLADLQQQVASGLAGLNGRIDTVVNTLTQGATSVIFDNFNRDAIGSGWTSVLGSLAIFQGPFGGGYVQTPAVSAGFYNVKSPLTDKQGALMKLVNKQAGTCRVIICSNTTLTNYAALEVRAGYFGFDYARIVTGSAPNVVVGQKQVNMAIGDNSVMDLRYDPAGNEFIATLGGKEIMRWADVTNIVSHGPTNRRQGILSNGDSGNVIEQGPAITDFTGYDW